MLFLLLPMAYSQQTHLDNQPITISGKAKSQGIDFFVTYNLKQPLILVFSISDSLADCIVFDYKESGTQVLDGYIRADGSIITDNIQNIRATSLTVTQSAANGIKVAFARDLNTGDGTDFVLRLDTATQICFYTSTVPYSSGVNYKGASKVCTYLSLHQKLGDTDDRLIGNYLSTTSYGGQSMELYGSQVTEIGSVQKWIYLTIYYGTGQGTSSFNLRWLRISPINTFTNTDAIDVSFTGGVVVTDNYCTSRNTCGLDTNQGGSSDVFRVAGGFNSLYEIVTFRRKYSTGDATTDTVLTIYTSRTLKIEIGNNEATTTANNELLIASPDMSGFNTLPRTTVGSGQTISSGSTSTNTNESSTPIIIRPVHKRQLQLLSSVLVIAVLCW